MVTGLSGQVAYTEVRQVTTETPEFISDFRAVGQPESRVLEGIWPTSRDTIYLILELETTAPVAPPAT